MKYSNLADHFLADPRLFVKAVLQDDQTGPNSLSFVSFLKTIEEMGYTEDDLEKACETILGSSLGVAKLPGLFSEQEANAPAPSRSVAIKAPPGLYRITRMGDVVDSALNPLGHFLVTVGRKGWDTRLVRCRNEWCEANLTFDDKDIQWKLQWSTSTGQEYDLAFAEEPTKSSTTEVVFRGTLGTMENVEAGQETRIKTTEVQGVLESPSVTLVALVGANASSLLRDYPEQLISSDSGGTGNISMMSTTTFMSMASGASNASNRFLGSNGGSNNSTGVGGGSATGGNSSNGAGGGSNTGSLLFGGIAGLILFCILIGLIIRAWRSNRHRNRVRAENRRQVIRFRREAARNVNNPVLNPVIHQPLNINNPRLPSTMNSLTQIPLNINPAGVNDGVLVNTDVIQYLFQDSFLEEAQHNPPQNPQPPIPEGQPQNPQQEPPLAIPEEQQQDPQQDPSLVFPDERSEGSQQQLPTSHIQDPMPIEILITEQNRRITSTYPHALGFFHSQPQQINPWIDNEILIIDNEWDTTISPRDPRAVRERRPGTMGNAPRPYKKWFHVNSACNQTSLTYRRDPRRDGDGNDGGQDQPQSHREAGGQNSGSQQTGGQADGGNNTNNNAIEVRLSNDVLHASQWSQVCYVLELQDAAVDFFADKLARNAQDTITGSFTKLDPLEGVAVPPKSTVIEWGPTLTSTLTKMETELSNKQLAVDDLQQIFLDRVQSSLAGKLQGLLALQFAKLAKEQTGATVLRTFGTPHFAGIVINKATFMATQSESVIDGIAAETRRVAYEKATGAANGTFDQKSPAEIFEMQQRIEDKAEQYQEQYLRYVEGLAKLIESGEINNEEASRTIIASMGLARTGPDTFVPIKMPEAQPGIPFWLLGMCGKMAQTESAAAGKVEAPAPAVPAVSGDIQAPVSTVPSGSGGNIKAPVPVAPAGPSGSLPVPKSVPVDPLAGSNLAPASGHFSKLSGGVLIGGSNSGIKPGVPAGANLGPVPSPFDKLKGGVLIGGGNSGIEPGAPSGVPVGANTAPVPSPFDKLKGGVLIGGGNSGIEPGAPAGSSRNPSIQIPHTGSDTAHPTKVKIKNFRVINNDQQIQIHSNLATQARRRW